MNSFTQLNKLELLKFLLKIYKGLESLEPHFGQRKEIAEIEEAIKKLSK